VESFSFRCFSLEFLLFFVYKTLPITGDMLPYRVVDAAGALVYVPVSQAYGYSVEVHGDLLISWFSLELRLFSSITVSPHE
jgi:hypothetical protein